MSHAAEVMHRSQMNRGQMNRGQVMSLSLAVFWKLSVALSGSQSLSEVKYRSKWGQIRSIFDKLVRLSKFSPWTKSQFRVLNHLTATPAWRFHYFLVVHDAKCITLCQNCIFSCSFFREMCVARDKLLCICFWESLFSVARLQTFLIGPWPWALILVIMT